MMPLSDQSWILAAPLMLGEAQRYLASGQPVQAVITLQRLLAVARLTSDSTAVSDQARLAEIEPVRVEVNERGTPFLYFPDGEQPDGEGCREATVAEARFWRERQEALAALREAEQREDARLEEMDELWKKMKEAERRAEEAEKREVDIHTALAEANVERSAGVDEPLWSDAQRVRLLYGARDEAERRLAEASRTISSLQAALSAEKRDDAPLEEALREIAEYEEPGPQDPSDVYEHFQAVARAALASEREAT